MTLPLILLPGLLCDQALWEHQIKALQGKVDVLVPDLTGFDNMQDLAAHVLATAPERFMLGGLSMGGYVAQEIMRQAPERVSRLFLIDTSARADTPEQTRRRQGLIHLAGKGDFKGVTPRLLPMLVAPHNLENTIITQTIMDMAQRVGKEAFVRQQTAILTRINSIPSLANIKVPTTIICGEEDALTPPEHAHEIARAIGRNTPVHIIAKAGHLAPLEAPEQVNALMLAAIAKD